jgi:hypothetical protein
VDLPYTYLENFNMTTYGEESGLDHEEVKMILNNDYIDRITLTPEKVWEAMDELATRGNSEEEP